jgi:hypothetical protein
MIPNYLVIAATSAEELQATINDKAKTANGGYHPINISSSHSVSHPYMALLEAGHKS